MKRWCNGNHKEDGLCRNPVYLDGERYCIGKTVQNLIATEQAVLDNEWQTWVIADTLISEEQVFLDAHWEAAQEFGQWGY
jgi:hypothetical protein